MGTHEDRVKKFPSKWEFTSFSAVQGLCVDFPFLIADLHMSEVGGC